MTNLRLPLTAILLLVLSGPAFASPQHPTPAELKAIDRFYDAFLGCQNYIENNDSIHAIPKEENQRHKKACDSYQKLGHKLYRQGFCEYKYYSIGRPDKNGDCVALPDH